MKKNLNKWGTLANFALVNVACWVMSAILSLGQYGILKQRIHYYEGLEIEIHFPCELINV